jgi:predicted ATPase/class 3 adenylate cyclase
MTLMLRDLPSGTVTFLFTDVEGSTRLLHERGPDAYAGALAEHRRILREAFGAHGGVEVDTQGDAFFVAFPTAPGALQAAAAAVKGLAPGPIRVRMGIHTGTPHLSDEGYVGVDVHRAARIAACGHGGQVLVSASTAALLNTSNLRDLGAHRLKDLSAPERIFQLGDDEFPPLRSLYRTNLPIASTPFLGRQAELTEILELLAQDGVRLVTLTGPGGTGKTRLAAQVAAELNPRYPHGVWWIALAALRDPQLVLEAAAGVLGAKDGVAQHIADRSVLLLFDNFEQVVEAAEDIADLLTSCPKLDVLVTSREPLHIGGEHEYAVPALVHKEAIGLFLARARAVRRDFEGDGAVSEICRRLDDLPLALELAAARVKALSPRRILERLEQHLPVLADGARDLPDRQRTLTAAIAWSYDLLSESEQRLFGRLSVFVGGCTYDAAAIVCGADLDTFAALVDKSLLRLEGDRYVMLETIREYAHERFISSGDVDDVRERHARYYASAAERPRGLALGSDTPAKDWLKRLDSERQNIAAALAFLVSRADTASAADLIDSVYLYWLTRGHLQEGRSWTEKLLAMPGVRDRVDIGRHLVIAGEFPRFQGDYRRARELKEEGLAIHRRTGTKAEVAADLHDLGFIVARDNDYAGARALHEEALQLRRELGDPDGISHALNGLTGLALQEGDYTRAAAWAEEEVATARAAGLPLNIGYSVHNLGEAYRGLRELPRATDLYLEALSIAFEYGDAMLSAGCVNGMAHVAFDIGDLESAARLFGRFEGMTAEAGLRLENAADTEKKIEALRSGAGPRFEDNWQVGREMKPEEVRAECTGITRACKSEIAATGL